MWYKFELFYNFCLENRKMPQKRLQMPDKNFGKICNIARLCGLFASINIQLCLSLRWAFTALLSAIGEVAV